MFNVNKMRLLLDQLKRVKTSLEGVLFFLKIRFKGVSGPNHISGFSGIMAQDIL